MDRLFIVLKTVAYLIVGSFCLIFLFGMLGSEINQSAETQPSVGVPNNLNELDTQPSPAEPTMSFADICSHQNVVENLREPFEQAIRQISLQSLAQSGQFNMGELWIGRGVVDSNLAEAQFVYRDIRNLSVEDDRPDTLTIRCETDLRLLTPIAGSEGAFSSYVQFNNARYAIRARQYGTPNEEVYILAEIVPRDGVWDIETGTE